LAVNHNHDDDDDDDDDNSLLPIKTFVNSPRLTTASHEKPFEL